MLSAGWSWAALAFCVGMAETGSKVRSAALGTSALLIAVLAYYAVKAGQGDYESADLSDPTGQTTSFAFGEFLSMAVLWCVVSCILGPILGVSGHMARRGRFRVLFQVLVPIVAIGETSMRLQHEAPLQESLVGTTWSVVRALSIVAVLAVIGYALFDNWRRGAAKRTEASS
ncbi:DUF6518 family protein [Streptomyces sp. NPDC057438]|uniref:DUF6518 family protein n=1 Tax=Streptomyces sp. NPDC057438 TaxID=3346133 RepID=UPI003691C713